MGSVSAQSRFAISSHFLNLDLGVTCVFWLTTGQLGRKELLDDPKGNPELPLAMARH